MRVPVTASPDHVGTGRNLKHLGTLGLVRFSELPAAMSVLTISV